MRATNDAGYERPSPVRAFVSDYATPFLNMAGGILVSTLIYRRVFRPVELSVLGQRPIADLPKATSPLRAGRS